MKTKLKITDAIKFGNDLIEALAPFCERIEYAGSIRRQKPLVGDIEIMCMPKKVAELVTSQCSLFDPPEYQFYNHPGLMQVISQFEVLRGDLDKIDAKQISFLGPDNIQVDLFVGNISNYGYIKTLRTGSHEYNTHYIMPQLKRAGYSLHDGYIWQKNRMIPVPEEVDVYHLFGAREIDAPEKRSEIGIMASSKRFYR